MGFFSDSLVFGDGVNKNFYYAVLRHAEGSKDLKTIKTIKTRYIDDNAIERSIKNNQLDIASYYCNVLHRPIKRPSWLDKILLTSTFRDLFTSRWIDGPHSYFVITALLLDHYPQLDLSMERLSFLIGKESALTIIKLNYDN